MPFYWTIGLVVDLILPRAFSVLPDTSVGFGKTTEANVYFLDGLHVFFCFNWILSKLSFQGCLIFS